MVGNRTQIKLRPHQKTGAVKEIQKQNCPKQILGEYVRGGEAVQKLWTLPRRSQSIRRTYGEL
jgi:hypothetical protein